MWYATVVKAFARLILPIDGSAASNRGVAFAAQLAKAEGSTVEVCSAIDETALMLPLAEGALVDPAPLMQEMETATAAYMADAVSLLHGAGITAQATVLRGNPVAEIDGFARKVGGNAIVLGTNGRGGMERMFMGSVTMAVLRIVDMPVVTVHSDDTLKSGPLIVAIDASSASEAALECAIERALVTGAALQLLHVFEESRVERLSVAIGLRPQIARRQALNDAENALEEAAEHVRAAGVAFTTELERGHPTDAIIAAAERHGAGGIAIGTHGRGGLERFVLGSVADGVVRSARVPVYVVHRRNRKPHRLDVGAANTARA